MNKLQTSAVLLEACNALGHNGSWCGETHIQKSVYFLEDLLGVPLEFPFIVYKHGPFSFELRDKLTEMRADGLLAVVPRQYPYGPSLEVTDDGENFLKRFPTTLGQYEGKIRFVAQRLGKLGVTQLERISTALFVRNELGSSSTKAQKISRILELKPHLTPESAEEAVETVEEFVAELRDY